MVLYILTDYSIAFLGKWIYNEYIKSEEESCALYIIIWVFCVLFPHVDKYEML
jgi:hypothetical protein